MHIQIYRERERQRRGVRKTGRETDGEKEMCDKEKGNELKREREGGGKNM